MFDSWFYFLGMGALLVLVSLVAPPLLAARKGYSWYLWTIACGLLGLIILMFLPFANKPHVGEKVNQSRRHTGNTIGAVLSAIGPPGILFGAFAAVSVVQYQRALGNTWGSGFAETLLILSPNLVVDLVGMALALWLGGRDTHGCPCSHCWRSDWGS